MMASFLVLTGSAFLLLGSVGLIRMPDVYNRIHAAGVTGALGLVTVLVGAAALLALEGLPFIKPLLAIVLMNISNPVGTHMIARAAYLTGVPMAPQTNRDDLNLHAHHPGAE